MPRKFQEVRIGYRSWIRWTCFGSFSSIHKLLNCQTKYPPTADVLEPLESHSSCIVFKCVELPWAEYWSCLGQKWPAIGFCPFILDNVKLLTQIRSLKSIFAWISYLDCWKGFQLPLQTCDEWEAFYSRCWGNLNTSKRQHTCIYGALGDRIQGIELWTSLAKSAK